MFAKSRPQREWCTVRHGRCSRIDTSCRGLPSIRWIQSIEQYTNGSFTWERAREKERKREAKGDCSVFSVERDRARDREDAEWSLLRWIQSPCEKRRDRQRDRLCMHHAGVYSGKCRASFVVASSNLVATRGRIELHLRTIFPWFGGTWDFSNISYLSLSLSLDTWRYHRRLSAIRSTILATTRGTSDDKI